MYEVNVMDSLDREQYKLQQNVIMSLETMFNRLDAYRASASLKAIEEEIGELLQFLVDDDVPVDKIEAARRDPVHIVVARTEK